MDTVTYSLGMSIDGYCIGPDGRFDWTDPHPDEFAFATEQIREVGVHLMGRRLYEAMLYWEDEVDLDSDLDDATRTWTELWRALPKVVFSRTLTEVRGHHTRLATDDPAVEIARLREDPTPGGIAIGGADLAAEIAALDLIDEYRPKVYPVLVGGGVPYFPQHARRVDLDLVETRSFASAMVYQRYRVVRDAQPTIAQ